MLDSARWVLHLSLGIELLLVLLRHLAQNGR
jgi:hypothetical protein